MRVSCCAYAAGQVVAGARLGGARSRVVSFACELLRERCWAAAAASAGVLETRAHSYLASLLHAKQKRLHAPYEAGACACRSKLAPAARQQRGRSSLRSGVSLFGLDAVAYRRQCQAELAPAMEAKIGRSRKADKRPRCSIERSLRTHGAMLGTFECRRQATSRPPAQQVAYAHSAAIRGTQSR